MEASACLDPRDLNKVIKREHHKIPTAHEVASKLTGKKVFSILDEKFGFCRISLDQESSFLCTFNSPFGRYRFLRCPFGISSAPEVFNYLEAMRVYMWFSMILLFVERVRLSTMAF